MTNHVHLLVTPARTDSCAQLMKRLAQLHTQYVNRTYGRTGSLWEGRFQSSLVQSENYLLNCYKYIELNPVEAGLCKRADEYDWSSCKVNANGAHDALVTPHDEYLRLGGTSESRRAAYRELLETPLSSERRDEIEKAANGNFVLGDRAFAQSVSAKLGRRAYPGSPGRPSNPMSDAEDQPDLFAAGKNVVCP